MITGYRCIPLCLPSALRMFQQSDLYLRYPPGSNNSSYWTDSEHFESILYLEKLSAPVLIQYLNTYYTGLQLLNLQIILHPDAGRVHTVLSDLSAAASTD